ncbi:winged helix DNA-binding protein [Staphylococcus shinii]|jgi:DNA-binding MarR family transcriptional regulator|uniref:MarR family winged helix-turn-helix transcriptional regulator n=1 Tax=Staphylococcus shinii TaxID=2912228 RepID=UPI00298F2AA8|nr:winged helix DNA-binding protein [Staphylococcus shinii]MDW8569055.1 winged helix DNA-binding protein [Staphylococcus shinii]MDW8572362.1 winged helix DNA-binding protein [Staphylococcus shinii]
MNTSSIFNNLIAIYRPYTKLFSPIFEDYDLYPAQWLVMKDIVLNSPTTLVQISKRRAIEKPTTRKILKVLSEKSLLKIETGDDKREKLLSFSEEGQDLYDKINKRVSIVQEEIIQKTGLSEDDLQHTIKVIEKIHKEITKMEEI